MPRLAIVRTIINITGIFTDFAEALQALYIFLMTSWLPFNFPTFLYTRSPLNLYLIFGSNWLNRLYNRFKALIRNLDWFLPHFYIQSKPVASLNITTNVDALSVDILDPPTSKVAQSIGGKCSSPYHNPSLSASRPVETSGDFGNLAFPHGIILLHTQASHISL